MIKVNVYWSQNLSSRVDTLATGSYLLWCITLYITFDMRDNNKNYLFLRLKRNGKKLEEETLKMQEKSEIWIYNPPIVNKSI